MYFPYTCKGLSIKSLFVCVNMVHGRRVVDPKLFNMLRKIATGVEAIELEKNEGRYLDDVQGNEYDSFWDELHERIDDLEESDLSWNLRIRKNFIGLVKEIMKRRRYIM